MCRPVFRVRATSLRCVMKSTKPLQIPRPVRTASDQWDDVIEMKIVVHRTVGASTVLPRQNERCIGRRVIAGCAPLSGPPAVKLGLPRSRVRLVPFPLPRPLSLLITGFKLTLMTVGSLTVSRISATTSILPILLCPPRYRLLLVRFVRPAFQFQFPLKVEAHLAHVMRAFQLCGDTKGADGSSFRGSFQARSKLVPPKKRRNPQLTERNGTLERVFGIFSNTIILGHLCCPPTRAFTAVRIQFYLSLITSLRKRSFHCSTVPAPP